jgi:hypothetical protein
VVLSLFVSARLQMFYSAVQEDEATYVDLVVDGLESLRMAVRGEEINCCDVMGFGCLAILEPDHIATPWGIARHLPKRPLSHCDISGRAVTATAVVSVPRRALVTAALVTTTPTAYTQPVPALLQYPPFMCRPPTRLCRTVIEPKEWSRTGDDELFLTDLHWKNWGGQEADG